MRNVALCLAPLVAAGLLIACEDDGSTGGGGTFNPDSGTYQPPPTTTPSPSDGGADTGSPDGDVGPAPLTVTVMRGNGPAANVEIVFHDAAGAVISTAKTDAAGKVVNTGPVPAQVSALLGGSSNRRIHTWTDVADHDQLFVNDTFSADGDDVTGIYNVTLPGRFQSAVSYKLFAGPCLGAIESDTAPQPYDLYVRLNCQRPQMSVLARAYDQGNNQYGFAFKKGIAPILDGTTVPVTLGNWAAGTKLDFSVTNTPTDVSIHGNVLEIADGLGFFAGENVLVANGQTTPVEVAKGFADAHQFTGTLSNWESRRSITKRVPSTTTAASLDFATVLPEISQVGVDGAEPLRPTVTWSAAGPLGGTDGGGVILWFTDARESMTTWTFTVSPGATSVKAPAMPADAADWLPRAGTGTSSTFQEPEVFFVESDVLSYEQFRSQAGRFVPMDDVNDPNRADKIVLPQDGTLRTTQHVYIQPL
ncbi:hypothetical protein AKJ09_03319 [Labilithrix luteola]|uniref:Big-1 domain-containing protein n=1 Tax=Labilithrix luteola TaxID=1391654 RepID=A0A0K1PSY3_9BACT|nr:hypothetical protein [Labilithrix luteola]AKU96655.1 hypothetical protein AKJ09_03319 [Labilithrix luteola]